EGRHSSRPWCFVEVSGRNVFAGKEGVKMGKPRKILTIPITFFIRNCGDGSCAVDFFRNRRDAEAWAGSDDDRFCDDIQDYTIKVYADDLSLVRDEVEQENLREETWNAREKAENAMRREKNPKKKAKLKKEFGKADKAWKETYQ